MGKEVKGKGRSLANLYCPRHNIQRSCFRDLFGSVHRMYTGGL